MDKEIIINEIKRIAAENRGEPPGKRAFEKETGIPDSSWSPYLWLRWSDAIKDAGFEPNSWQRRLDDSYLFEHYIALVRELGRFPISGELRIRKRKDPTFPNDKVFDRFGGKKGLIKAIKKFCAGAIQYTDIIKLCDDYLSDHDAGLSPTPKTKVKTGFVYLMKSGKHFKIGRTNSVGTRERQLSIIVPIPPKVIHKIETDDPVGVEAYWHRRFGDKRGEGEWFDLSSDDIEAFKRWKRIV